MELKDLFSVVKAILTFIIKILSQYTDGDAIAALTDSQELVGELENVLVKEDK